MSEQILKSKDCKHRQKAKNTLRGVWADCRLGKGYDCIRTAKYCRYEPRVKEETTNDK